MVASGWGVNWLERNIRELSGVMKIFYTLKNLCILLCTNHTLKIKIAIALLYFAGLINDLWLAHNLT